MNLLVLEDRDEKELVTNRHLVLIKNFNCLVSGGEQNNTCHSIQYCERCLAKFYNKLALENH